MKNNLLTAAITLFIGLTVAYFGFSLNKEYVDLRYTLSEKIPTKFVETSTAETVQQLVVKNNGNIPATKIQITIDGFVEDYDILKNSISDVVEEHKSKEHFEAIYPSLPPDAQFSYIFKTSGIGITKLNLSIKHNKGKAIEALANGGISITGNILSSINLAAFILYFILLSFQIRSFAIDRLESSANYVNYYDYLNKKKPLYISQEKWNSIRRSYIEKKITADYLHSSDFEGTENYKILNQDKPNFITNDEWELLKEISSKSLADLLISSIKKTSQFEILDKYFALKKPVQFPEKKWQEIVKEINENYIKSQKLKLHTKFYSSAKDIKKELEVGMPTGMLLSYWENYKEFLIERYYEEIYKDVLRWTFPITDLKEIDLSILSKDKQESLEDLAYRIQLLRIDNISSLYTAEEFIKNDKPEWIKQDDLKRLEEKAKAYIAIEKSIRKNESLSNALYHIVNYIPLKDRPETLDSKEWEKVIELESKTSTIAIQNKEDKYNIVTEKQEIKYLKDKILRQLSIINDVLNDPESIYKIESYDNPFSEGNFVNLQKISKYVIELQKKT